MLCHTNLENYYRYLFLLVQRHKYTLSELESIMPFERDLYVDMIVAEIEKEKNNA